MNDIYKHSSKYLLTTYGTKVDNIFFVILSFVCVCVVLYLYVFLTYIGIIPNAFILNF